MASRDQALARSWALAAGSGQHLSRKCPFWKASALAAPASWGFAGRDRLPPATCWTWALIGFAAARLICASGLLWAASVADSAALRRLRDRPAPAPPSLICSCALLTQEPAVSHRSPSRRARCWPVAQSPGSVAPSRARMEALKPAPCEQGLTGCGGVCGSVHRVSRLRPEQVSGWNIQGQGPAAAVQLGCRDLILHGTPAAVGVAGEACGGVPATAEGVQRSQRRPGSLTPRSAASRLPAGCPRHLQLGRHRAGLIVCVHQPGGDGRAPAGEATDDCQCVSHRLRPLVRW